MKIFNVENGIEKVYVQSRDLDLLYTLNIPMSMELYFQLPFLHQENEMAFIEFIKPSEIDFFKSQDWIIDYKKIRALNKEEISLIKSEIAKNLDQTRNQYYSMSKEERANNDHLQTEQQLLTHKIKSINELLHYQAGGMKIPFPITPDSDSSFVVENDDSPYILKESLEKNKLLLFRKDNKPLSKEDRIPQGIFKAGMSISMMNNSQENELLESFEPKKYLSPDNQYVIFEYKPITNDQNSKKKKRFKTILKTIFDPIKK